MANIFRDIWTRIKIDWTEYQGYRTSVWNVKRDERMINRAINRARMKNKIDGRTYYVLRNLGGGFDEVNSGELLKLKQRKVKYFPKFRDYNHLISVCFAIVTSNEVTRQSYVETVRNIQNDEISNLQPNKTKDNDPSDSFVPN